MVENVESTITPKTSHRFGPMPGYFNLIKTTGQEWVADKAPTMAASLAYYTIMSLAPLLVIALAMAGIFLGEKAATGQLTHQLENFMGADAAKAINGMLENAHKSKGGTLASIISFVLLIFSATGLVGQLKEALNTMWNVEKKPGLGIKGFFRDRVLSLGLVLGIGFLLLVSMVVSTVITAAATFVGNALPVPPFMMRLLDLGISALVITVLFAMIFKFLPDVKIAWKHVWLGAALTAILFVIGKFLIGLYLGKSSVASGYGAAGSLIVVLLWIYYSSLILFFGAEFTQVYAKHSGQPVVPNDMAMSADSPEALALQPKITKAITHEGCVEAGVEKAAKPAKASSAGAASSTSLTSSHSDDNLEVALPTCKKRGSVTAGVLSFLMVSAVNKLSRPKSPSR